MSRPFARAARGAQSRAKGAAGRVIPANSVARAMVQVGDRWSLMVLGAAFGGAHRFTDWREQIGIASNILTERLRHLVHIGCLERLPANSGRRSVYRLTKKGCGLYPVALMFWRFDRAWSTRRPRQPSNLVHHGCGQVMTPMLVCAHCRAPVYPREVEYASGPGACLERMPALRNSRRSGAALAEDATGLFGESIDIFGDRWTQMIIGMFFLGDRRFEDIRSKWHIATNILSDRLKLLVEHGILQKRVYQVNPERSEYLLTPKGMDTYPIMLTLSRWGDCWLAPEGKPPLVLFHRRCGKLLDPVTVCSHCEAALDCHEVSIVGRGAPRGRAATPDAEVSPVPSP